MSAEPEVVKNKPPAEPEPATKTVENAPLDDVKEAETEPEPQRFYPSNSKLVIAEALDNYFEEDENLKLLYDTEQPVEKLLELPLVKATGPNLETLIAAVESCKKLTIDSTKTLVRASAMSQRVTLILRDLPEDVKYIHIKTLLENEALTSQLTSRVKEIRPELNNNWFVSFANQHDCLNAALWLNLNGKIGDKKVRCRVKSVLPQSTYNSSRAPTDQNFDYYARQQPYAGQQFYGNYPQYPPQQPQQNQRRSSGRNRRNSKGRGGGKGRHNNNNNYNNASNNNNNGNNSNNNNSNGSGFQRQSSVKRRNSRTQKKAAQQKARVKPEAVANGDIDYPGKFVLINRTTFSQIITEALLAEDVPNIPLELEQCPDLKAPGAQNIDFSIGPLMSGMAISPFPSAKQGPLSGDDAPPDFSLDGNEPEKKKKKKKSKKKEKAKAVAKPVAAEAVAKPVTAEAVAEASPKNHEVIFDDQKDEEPVPDFSAAQNEI